MRDDVKVIIPVPFEVREEWVDDVVPEWVEPLVDSAISQSIERDGRGLHEVGPRRIDWLPGDTVICDADGQVIFDLAAQDMSALRVLSACED